MNYLNCDKALLEKEYEALVKQYEEVKGKGLNLNMARGKPANDQLALSMEMLDVLNSSSTGISEDGVDCKNYGLLEGLSGCRKLFAEILEVEPENVFIGGNSSLNMMFDTISTMMTTAITEGAKPWYEVKDRKFLCPVPGYDRHFGITEYFGFDMIPVPMDENGPDMDLVEELVANDESIKGMWCVPKYSNPTGITFSDEVVKRIAALKPKAKDFRVMWDNAYVVHDVTDTPDTLLSIVDECKKAGNEDLPILFCSTSKITFPGAGVAAMASSKNNMAVFMNKYQFQTIGYDKLNMLRHMLFFKDKNGVLEHMNKHKDILKLDVVIDKLESDVKESGVATWTKPNGGYFVSVDVYEGTASEVVALCKEAGVVLTGAGATYPYGKDPKDSNIRVAPSFPPVSELSLAMDVFCICAKLAAAKKILGK